MPCSFDYLIYPHYPAYTMECYQIVIRRDNKRLVTIFARVYYSGNYSYYQAFYSKKCDARLTKQMAAQGASLGSSRPASDGMGRCD